MKKNYFIFLLLVFAFFTTQISVAQNNSINAPIQENIEGLSIYPNPVNSGTTYIHITTKRNFNKKIEFFNVLGKRIFSTVLTGKELNISNLSKGVYVLKITEGELSETRKLVIK